MKTRRLAPRAPLVWGGLLLQGGVVVLPAAAQPRPPTSAYAGGTAAAQPATGGVVALLLQQARYWRGQSQFDQAQTAIARALQVAPTDPDVLEAEGELQGARGDGDAMRRTLARLQQIDPSSPQALALARASKVQAIDPGTLGTIRAAAAAGDNEAAATGYRTLFANQPPPDYALEYYQTLAGTQSGWTEAHAGLARFVARDPDDLQAQLAFAQMLTYREPTRAQGIARLQVLAAQGGPVSTAAARNWRQALLWLPSTPASLPLLRRWLQDHPDDTQIADRIQHASVLAPVDGNAAGRGNGFDALAAGRLEEAATQFSTVLSHLPNDADALGGLGLVRSRQNRTEEAAQLLRRAIAADPATGGRWQPALDGLSVSNDYAAARDLIAHGRFAEAQTRLEALIHGPGDTTGAQLMLADLQRRQGRQDASGETLEQILARHPDNADALLGLARIRTAQGRQPDAQALLDRLGGRRGREVAQIEGQQYSGQAEQSGDPRERIDLLRQAIDRDPNDPWLRLRLAQALLATGQKADARATMAPIAEQARPSIPSLQAAILFAGQTDDLPTAGLLLARLPRRGRTADTQAIADRVALSSEIEQATADGVAGSEGLVSLASHPDPTGARGVQIAKALDRMGNRAAALRALSRAQQATAQATASQLLSYAGERIALGDSHGAQAVLATLDRSGARLSPDQQTARRQLSSGLAVVDSDRLNEQGRQADAFDRLAPVLAADPDAVAPKLALARLYQSDDRPRQALQLDLAVLQREPADLDARLAAVRAAIDCHDMGQAGTLARDALVIDPQDPRSWLAAAAVHTARGAGRQAMQDLQRARALRRQQLGTDTAAVIDTVVARDTPAVDDNPFRRQTGDDRGTDNGAGPDGDDIDIAYAADPLAAGRTKPAPDQLLTSIDTQIDALHAQMAPTFDVNIGLRSRSGSGGLDSLTELTAPLTATLPLGAGSGHWLASVTPTSVTSGSLDQSATSVDRFGTLALGGSGSDGQSSQAGVGLLVGYANRWLKTDVGTSPLGFRTTNILGGVELAPQLSRDVTLRLTAERRAVTDSVLSYAGERDPGTGDVWGGVTRTRGHGQIEIANGTSVIYAGGGFASLTGAHVASNSEIEAGAGGSVQVWKNGEQQVRVGIDLTYFGYNKNLRYFTLGQGGYFSPQDYVAATLPVTWTGKDGAWSWTLAGSLGYQNYNEHQSDYYPDNASLQAELVASGAATTVYAADSKSGLAGSANGKIEYQLTPSLVLGGTASYQRTGNWDEAQALITARYILPEKP